MNPLVIARLPKAGLANKLFVWARARVFSHENQLPFLVIGWFDPKLGPWIRREKNKRIYYGYFHTTGNLWHLVKYMITVRKKSFIVEPTALSEGRNFYIFSKIPHWDQYFEGLMPYRDYLKTELFNLMKPHIQQKIHESQVPEVGIHIRMGDFKKITNESEFKNVGATRTPLNYFVTVINQLKVKLGPGTHFSVFSDGHRGELNEVLSIPNVSMAQPNPDIIDLWLLSQSKVIVTSAGSTFSYWAVFLSEADIIYHENFIFKIFASNKHFEGSIFQYMEDFQN